MAPSHVLMTIDQDGLWSWELGYQEKLYQGMGGGMVKGRVREVKMRDGEGEKEAGGRERRPMSCQINLLSPLYTSNGVPFPPIPPCLESSFIQDLFLPSRKNEVGKPTAESP